MRILAIETSCDDTAAAVIERTSEGVFVRSSIVSSQIAPHATYGGVVPNLAAREHVKNMIPVINTAFLTSEFAPGDIDLIAVTQGPGLIPALLVGTTTAKTLSFLWHKPLIGIHHIEGHIYANFIATATQKNSLVFPLLALIVSGGHTALILMRDHFQYEVLGETQDDAVGECFDKAARLLGLAYPGGPIVAKRADDFRQSISENRHTASWFPRPMLKSNDLNFSFSGLKTSLLYFLKKHEVEKSNEHFVSKVCHEFQEAIVDVLVSKTRSAILSFQPSAFIIAGGVSANVRLRDRLHTLIKNDFPNTHFFTPEFQYCLDNAAMIGTAAAFRYQTFSSLQQNALMTSWRTLEPRAHFSIATSI